MFTLIKWYNLQKRASQSRGLVKKYINGQNKLVCLSLTYLSSLVSCLAVGYGLTDKDLTRLERIAKDKPFSLFGPFINYGRKMFYGFGNLGHIL